MKERRFCLSKRSRDLDPTDTGSLLVFLQIQQQLTETLLARSAGTALGSLAGDVDQFRNTFPAGAAGRGVLPVGKELFGLGLCLCAELVGLVVVGDVEVVDVFSGFLDGRVLLLFGDLGAAGDFRITLLAPFPGDSSTLERGRSGIREWRRRLCNVG